MHGMGIDVKKNVITFFTLAVFLAFKLYYFVNVFN